MRKHLEKFNLIIALLLILGTLTAAVLEQVNTTSSQTLSNKTLSSPVMSGTITGTYTLGGTPTFGTISGATLATPTFSGTASGSLTNLTLITPALGTPSALTLTNATGLPISTGVSGLGTGVATFLGTPSSANLATAVTGESGSGALLFGTSPSIASPTLSGTATGTYTLGGTPSITAPTLTGTTAVTGLLNLSGASAGQIQFPATQNSSANANTLDDYEEGSWTPTLGGTTTYTLQSGSYTKIGRVVYVRGAMQVNTIGTGSSGTISGLPCTALAQDYGVSLGTFSSLINNVTALYGRVNASNATASFFGASAAASANTGVSAIFGNSTALTFTAWYEAASCP